MVSKCPLHLLTRRGNEESFLKKKEKQQELSPVGPYSLVECVGREARHTPLLETA